MDCPDGSFTERTNHGGIATMIGRLTAFGVTNPQTSMKLSAGSERRFRQPCRLAAVLEQVRQNSVALTLRPVQV